MKVIYKITILSVLTAILIALWIPNFIVGQPALAEGETLGSTVGGVEVSGLKGDALKNAITVAVSEWMEQPVVVLDGSNTLLIQADQFQFDVEATVIDYEQNYQKSWYEFWDKGTTIHLPLIVTANESVKSDIESISGWQHEETYAKVLSNVSYLKEGEIEAVIGDLAGVETERLSVAIEQVPAKTIGMDHLIRSLNDTIINPGETFSMLEKIDVPGEVANSEAINFVASMIYNAALHADTEIVERHSQNKVPVYLQAGIEAMVDIVAEHDLKFANTSNYPIKLKISTEGSDLKVELFTSYKETDVTVRVVSDETIDPRTIVRYTDELAIGQSQVLQKGNEGLRVSVFRTILGEQQLISRDYYAPTNQVLLKSSRQPVTTTTPDSTGTTGSTDPDLEIDLNGDGLADQPGTGNTETPTPDSSNDSPVVDNGNTPKPDSPNPSKGTGQFPEGSYYDKGGNLITP